jgi:hypothetical protein
MSNYHYNDQGGCPSCISKGGYSDLANTTNYTCDQPCLCRFTGDRSNKDKMYYDWFVLNQPMKLTPGKIIAQPSNNNCNKQK